MRARAPLSIRHSSDAVNPSVARVHRQVPRVERLAPPQQTAGHLSRVIPVMRVIIRVIIRVISRVISRVIRVIRVVSRFPSQVIRVI